MEIFELVSGGRKALLFASLNATLLGDVVALCGQVPQEWKSFWDSQEFLRYV